MFKNVVLQEKVSCTRGNFHSPSIHAIHAIYFFLFISKSRPNGIMSEFDLGNSVNCVLLDVNLYQTKREK